MGNKIILTVKFYTSTFNRTYERNNDNIGLFKRRYISRDTITEHRGAQPNQGVREAKSMFTYGALDVFVIPGESPTLGIGNEERNGVL